MPGLARKSSLGNRTATRRNRCERSPRGSWAIAGRSPCAVRDGGGWLEHRGRAGKRRRRHAGRRRRAVPRQRHAGAAHVQTRWHPVDGHGDGHIEPAQRAERRSCGCGDSDRCSPTNPRTSPLLLSAPPPTSPWPISSVTTPASESALRVPNCRLTWELGEDGYLDTLWLLATDSWASVQDTLVRQAGVRRLWDEAAAGYSRWVQSGRPGRDRYGVSVTADRQSVWLDDPANPYLGGFWPLTRTHRHSEPNRTPRPCFDRRSEPNRSVRKALAA